MGWQDAPPVNATQQPKWASAPAVTVAEAATVKPQRTLGQEAVRQLGLTGRYLAEGAANVAGIATNPLSELMRQVGMNVQNVPESVTGLLDRAGFPKPEGALENVIGSASRGVAGAMLPIGAGLQAAKLAGVTGRVGAEVAKAPVTQMGAAIGSAGAGEATKQAGGNEYAQLAANLVGGLAGGSIAGRMTTPKTKQTRLTADEIRERASREYQRAEQLGGTLKPQVTNDFLNEANTIRPKTPIGQALAAESDFEKTISTLNQNLTGKPMTLAEATEIDQFLTDRVNSFVLPNGKLDAQGNKLMQLQDKLRDIIDNVKLSDVVGQNKAGFDAVVSGRKQWAQAAKLRDIESIIQRASQMEQPATGIRTGFRTLYNNPKRMRGFTEAERKAIKQAAETGIVVNALRLMGSGLAPIGAGTAGFATGGPAGATVAGLASFGVQQAARKAAESLQLSKANRVADLIANRGMTVVPKDRQLLAKTLGTIAGSNQ